MDQAVHVPGERRARTNFRREEDRILAEQADLFRSQRLLREMKTFVRHPDGHAAAAEGAHDDCVMAMAIALAVRREDAGRVRRKGVEVASLLMG